MKVGGLFSGIGGWELGLQRAGFDIAWHCEADEFCRRVLERHWPGVPCYPDVTTLSGGMVEPIDVLCGGFPCQDLSVAGRHVGLEGARSGLWGHMLRLACELRPRYVLIENVSALLTGEGGAWMRRVLCDLAASGFDAEWDCLPALAFGAPHERDRVWIVAYPNEGDGQARVGDLAHGSPAIPPLRAGASSELWLQTPAVPTGMDDGFPDWLDRNGALGNALVPQIAEWIGRRILAYEGLA